MAERPAGYSSHDVAPRHEFRPRTLSFPSMRTAGILLIASGIFGFVYCGDQASRYARVPEGTGVMQSLEYPGGRWETGRYACAFGGALGCLLALFPKGR